LAAGTPTIFHTFHGSVFDGYFSPLKTRIFLTIERVLAHFTDRVITVSATLKKQLSEVYRIAPLDKIEVVPLGFDLTEFTQTAGDAGCQTDSPHGQTPTIGWVGRFTEIKDPLLFVDCATAIKATGLTAKFVMVGDGPLRLCAQQAISTAGLTADFSLPGWQRDMPRIYAPMRVLVCTSVNEGTPVTVIEAMAAGCPFVAPNVGGLADLAGQTEQYADRFRICTNGILVDQRRAETLQCAVSRLLSDPELRTRMSAAGRQFAVENFGEERLIRQTAALYESFLKPREEATHRALTRAGLRK
jgi:glycosyltransferase involved in cell wall biosynthesis